MTNKFRLGKRFLLTFGSHGLMVLSLLPLGIMFLQWGTSPIMGSVGVANACLVMAFIWLVFICGHWLAHSPRPMMSMLYLAFFISISTLLKTVPLPLGMTLAFLMPMLAAVYIHPLWGLLIGMLAQWLSALLLGGIGPWTPMQILLFVLFGGLMIWVPRWLRVKLWFQLCYMWVAGLAYGLVMSLYVWPVLSAATTDPSWTSFWQLYLSTSLAWDLFRAFGNVVLWLLLVKRLVPYGLRVCHWCRVDEM
jgi:hypothetical protein